MKNTVTNLLTFFLFLLVTNSLWTQAAGDFRSKLTGNWSIPGSWEIFDGANWNTAVVSPTSTDGVITILGGHNMTLNVNVTVDQLVISAGATLTQAANIMTVNDGPGTDLNCSGTVNYTNGTISGSGMIAFGSGATFIWGGGTINGNGQVVIEAGATLTMNSGNSKTLGGNRRLINKGTANYSDGNLFYQATAASDTSLFLNEGTLDINDRAINILAGHIGKGILTNTSTGIINKTGTGTLSFSGINLFTNSGTVNINGGTFSCTPVSTEHKSILNLASGTNLDIGSSTHLIQGGAVFNGPGTVNIPGGTMTLQVPLAMTNVPLNMTSGVINGTGNLTIQGPNTFTWGGGTINGSGSVVIEPGATLSMNGASSKTLGGNRRLINKATASFTAGNFFFQATAVSDTALFLNEGTLDVNDRIFNILAGHIGKGILTNATTGIINKTGAGTLSFSGINLFTNSGTVNINGGTFSCTPVSTEHKGVLNLSAGTSLSVASGTHLIQSGAAINGPGSISFTGGIMTLQTDFSLSTAVLNLNSGAILNGSSMLTINSGNTFSCGSGTIRGSNDVVIASGATFNITSGLDIYNNRRIINRGTCNWTGGHISFALNTGETASFQNEGTMNANFNSNLNIQAIGSFNGTRNFINTVTGVINKNNTGTMTIEFLNNFSHLGEFNINGGTFNMVGSYVSQTGNYTLASGAIFSGVALGFKGGQFTNNGSVTIAGLTFNGTTPQNLNGSGIITSLIINNANGVSLGGTQTINSGLTLTNGKITLGGNDLLLSSVATLTGGSSSSYVVTDGTGRFRRRVTNNNTNVLFPVGLASSYLPLHIKLTVGSTTDDFKLRVDDEFNSDYNPPGTANGATITEHVVRRMWFIEEAVAGGSDATIQFNWNAGDETTPFDRSRISVNQYDGSDWQTSSYGAAMGSGPYNFSKTGITSFREFGVADTLASVNGIVWYADADGDTFGDLNRDTLAASQPPGYTANFDDCDDANANVHPNATEVCNAIDDDCDGEVDEGVLNTFYLDSDADGFGDLSIDTMSCSAPAGFVDNDDDCDDTNANVQPNATEVCNNIDDDCDGEVDEGLVNTYYFDGDIDGFGDISMDTLSCSAPAGYVSNDDDCDDNNANVHPNATEVCNGIDDDCDGGIDEGLKITFFADVDGDGFGDPNNDSLACTQPAGYVNNDDDCDDTDINVQSSRNYYRDADGDGFGNPLIFVNSCLAPAGYVGNNLDCNDGNRFIKPEPDSPAVKIWDRTIGSGATEKLSSVLSLAEGNLMLLGISDSGIGGDKTQSSRGGTDFWTVKLNGSGIKINDRRYGGSGKDYLASGFLADQQKVIMAGSSNSPIGGDKTQGSRGNEDFWIIKTTSQGNIIWDRRFGGIGPDLCAASMKFSDQKYVIVGLSNSGAGLDKTTAQRGFTDYWIIMIDSAGNKLWDVGFGSNNSDYASSVVRTNDGGILVAGSSNGINNGDRTQNSRGGYDYWIVKMDSLGNKLWDKRFGGSGDDFLTSVLQDDQGNFILAGSSRSAAGGDKSENSRGDFDYWILKVSSIGNKIWDRRFGGSSKDYCFSLRNDVKGGFLLYGNSNSPSGGDKTQGIVGGSDYWLVKINQNGVKVWDRRFGGSTIDNVFDDIQTTPPVNISDMKMERIGNDIILGGYSYSSRTGDKSENNKGYGSPDYWVLKLMRNLPETTCNNIDDDCDGVVDDQAGAKITSCPKTINATTEFGVCHKRVYFNASAAPAGATITYSHASGTNFPKGVTRVKVTASNACGVDSCFFNVSILDAQLPTITCPADITITLREGECSISRDSVDLGVPTVTDNCPGPIDISNNAPSVYEVGFNLVSWHARDVANNSKSCYQSVTIRAFFCSAPIGVAVSEITANSATVSWQEVLCATDYKIRIRHEISPGNWSLFSDFESVSGPGLNHIFSGLSSNTLHEFEILTNCGTAGSTKIIGQFTTLSNFENEELEIRSHSGFGDSKQVTSIKVYPNPAQDLATVYLEGFETNEKELQMYDLVGKLVFKVKLAARQNQLDLKLDKLGLRSGAYFIKVADPVIQKSELLFIER